jgi:hypothetical protein
MLFPGDPALADPAEGIGVDGAGDADMPGFGHVHRSGRPVDMAAEGVPVAQVVGLDADLTHVHPDPHLDMWMVVEALLDLDGPLDRH